MTRTIDLAHVESLKRREDAAFAAARPRSAALLERARRSMLLGVPMSWMDFLFDHPPVFIDAGVDAHLLGRSQLGEIRSEKAWGRTLDQVR